MVVFPFGIVLLFMSLSSIKRIDAFGVRGINDCIGISFNDDPDSDDGTSNPVEEYMNDCLKKTTLGFPSIEYLFLQTSFISRTTLERILDGMRGPRRIMFGMESDGTRVYVTPVRSR